MIGPCAHQSLRNNATPELGMIPTRNKGTLAGSQKAKGISKFSQSKHNWVYQDVREVEGWIAKIVSLITELWTLAPDLAWLLNIYTPNTRKHPLLCYATHSLKLCLPFQCYSRCAKKKTNLSRSVYEVPSYTRFIKLVQTQFLSQPVQIKEKYAHTSRYKIMGWG